MTGINAYLRRILPSSVCEHLSSVVSASTIEMNALSDNANSDKESRCHCCVAVETPTGTGVPDRSELVVDATNCPGSGDLASASACRETVIDALTHNDVAIIRTISDGIERTYADDAAATLQAIGRFIERVRFHDPEIATRAREDPGKAAYHATGRAGPVGDIATDTGFDSLTETAVETALSPFVAPTLSRSHLERSPPPDATLLDVTDLSTDAIARMYSTDTNVDSNTEAKQYYHLDPAFHNLDSTAIDTLAMAYECLGTGSVDGGGGDGSRASSRAVRYVATDEDPVEALTAILTRHTQGLGVIEHLFADDRISDVIASSPVSKTPIRIVLDGERMATNIRLRPSGAATLASRFRRESGRAFSRSTPTLDATVTAETGRQIRIAGITAPASDGLGFAFRARDTTPWTLTRLLTVGSLTPAAAAFLSVVTARGAATIVAGTRGAGKTTLLGALLWELPHTTRLVSVEDTPELPVEALREHGRDIQPLYTETDTTGITGATFTPTAALRTALRLGNGALAIGEVRGEEAAALYEAMRVGAHSHAVLGTIHGDSGVAVRERVVSDLGVPASAFSATDLIVTCTRRGDDRFVSHVEEVRTGETTDDIQFVSLFTRIDGKLTSTGVIERGDSRIIERLCRGTTDSYADFRTTLADRHETLERRAEIELVNPKQGAVSWDTTNPQNPGE